MRGDAREGVDIVGEQVDDRPAPAEALILKADARRRRARTSSRSPRRSVAGTHGRPSPASARGDRVPFTHPAQRERNVVVGLRERLGAPAACTAADGSARTTGQARPRGSAGKVYRAPRPDRPGDASSILTISSPSAPKLCVKGRQQVIGQLIGDPERLPHLHDLVVEVDGPGQAVDLGIALVGRDAVQTREHRRHRLAHRPIPDDQDIRVNVLMAAPLRGCQCRPRRRRPAPGRPRSRSRRSRRFDAHPVPRLRPRLPVHGRRDPDGVPVAITSPARACTPATGSPPGRKQSKISWLVFDSWRSSPLTNVGSRAGAVADLVRRHQPRAERGLRIERLGQRPLRGLDLPVADADVIDDQVAGDHLRRTARRWTWRQRRPITNPQLPLVVQVVRDHGPLDRVVGAGHARPAFMNAVRCSGISSPASVTWSA